MSARTLLEETVGPMLVEREPNLLRLYLSPHVARTCLALDRYVRTTWGPPAGGGDYQSFLANGLEEALGGALKLLRYARGLGRDGAAVVALDPGDRLTGFAGLDLADGGRAEFLPGVRVLGSRELAGGTLPAEIADASILVLVAGADGRLDAHAEPVRRLAARRPAVITCVDREALAAVRRGAGGFLAETAPDVVVFDDSFTDRDVPFGAFTAPASLFAAWNRPGKSTFHSTTFQPNSVSTRHFMTTLAAADPDFARDHAADLRIAGDDLARRVDALRRHYNPSLCRLARAAGFESADVAASGAYVEVNGRRVLDLVGGVACSVRGHNPPSYPEEVAAIGNDAESELVDRLRRLTGLGCVLPAVSGGTAVENALKLALVARHPRRHVLALRAGFGGKTLFSLTGTANPRYKEKVGPLYPDVHYVDPFAPDATARIDELLGRYEFAAVLVELIQSVGGVRRIPEAVVRHLDARRADAGYLWVVDEVQTGMYRTGPFTQSEAFGVTPDLMLLGKGTSDMMFPFALTLASDEVADLAAARGGALLDATRGRFGYPVGYRTALNVLRHAEAVGLSARVTAAGGRFLRRLTNDLAPVAGVRDVRVFGLLAAVELDATSGLRRVLGKRLSPFYLLAMLRHPTTPLLAGFCQYEPNTLKITPPLDATVEVIDRASRAIADVLALPVRRVLLGGLGQLLRPTPLRKETDERRNDPAPQLAAR